MYSVVLMMAISGGGDAPTLGGRLGCGGGCNGCYASGCHGGGRCSGCFGGGGCFGMRGRFGCSGGCFGGNWCSGRVGCHGCAGGACCGGGAGTVPSNGPKVMPKKNTPGAKETPPSVGNETRATLIVHLPADATLKIDGSPTTATSERRVFSSPPLVPGSQYYYTLEAQVVRDGRPIRVSERVFVQPGQEREITLTMPAASGVTAR